MDISTVIDNVINHAESNPLIAVVAAVVFLYLLIRKPKLLLSVIVIALFAGAVMKLISKLFETSSF
jgi:hypothetical protein